MSIKSALVVDDSKSARFALRKYLESHAFQVDTAGSAAEALAFLEGHRPEIIFLDHVMPGADGFDTLRAIKANPQIGAIPVVICSSSEGEEFSQQARLRGAADVLQKPPSPQQLARVLEHLRQLSVATARQQRPAMLAAAGGGAPLAAAPAPQPSAAGQPPAAVQRGLQAVSAPASTMPPAAPSKVSNIREPETAIEQAVMKALRSALPVARPDARTEAAPPPPARDALREAMEQRLRSLSQDVSSQIAELRSSFAQAESRRQAAHGDLIHSVEQRITQLEHGFTQQLEDLSRYFEAHLAAQSEHLEQITQFTRAAAAEEAHNVAERAVMSAATRIADQLSSSILKALARA